MFKKIVKVCCPYCGQSLLTDEKKIDGQLCVHIQTTGGKTIFLSAIWNNFKKRGDRIPKGEIIEAICPHCQKSLTDKNFKCQTCGSPLILMDAKNDIICKVAICSQSGCHHNMVNNEIPIRILASP